MVQSLTSQLQAQALQKFGHSTQAFAYTFTHNGARGLRLEAPDIVKEYTDGINLGRDPKGLLFYYSLKPDFNEDKKALYQVSFPQQGEGHKLEIVLVIDFYRTDVNNPFARFVGTLPPRAQDDAKQGTYTGGANGSWKALNITQATSLASKEATSTTVEVVTKSLKKKLTFSVPASVQGDSPAMESWGYLIVRDTGELSGSGLIVDYTNTRILVLRDQQHTEPIAVFGSYEIGLDDQPFDASFQVYDGQFTNI